MALLNRTFLSVFILVTGVKGFIKLELNNPYPAFEPNFYDAALDTTKCDQQLDFISKNSQLALQFLDASARPPRGIWGANLMDLGNYHQCLSINYDENETTIKGKYCLINVKMGYDDVTKFQFGDKNLSSMIPGDLLNKYNKMQKSFTLEKSNSTKPRLEINNEEIAQQQDISPDVSFPIRLGVCIPRPCTVLNVQNVLNNNSILAKYLPKEAVEEKFCRLPNDKLWSPADYTAVVLFSFIGILTAISTGYDLIFKFVLQKEAKDLNPTWVIFSAYSNGRRLVSKSSPDTLRCLDGIRVMAMFWVMLGHTMQTQMKYLNIMDFVEWIRSLQSVYATSAPITVDTFFTMTGILLVYTTCAKMKRSHLIKWLPLFYLHRLLRMFPLLATTILLQASFFHHLYDGPMWTNVAMATDNCRTQWWVTLLYMQNFINTFSACLAHSWYLAIDMHLYISSPLVLFWVLGTRRTVAWTALIVGLVIFLGSATVYNFMNNFVPHNVAITERMTEVPTYMKHYYFNVLTRASPFFVGMMFGYLLHIHKGERINLSWRTVAFLWTSSTIVTTSIFFSTYFILQDDFDNQFLNNVINSFMRPAWALSIGWMILACVHGYGGPVNWYLSLDMWRVPARLCYGAYLLHYPLMLVVADSVVEPIYFSVPRLFFMFVGLTTISFLLSFIATLLIDAPFSLIFKRLLQFKKNDQRTKRPKENYPENIDLRESNVNKDSYLFTPIIKVGSINNIIGSSKVSVNASATDSNEHRSSVSKF